jgi:hypothetical protein
MEYKRVQNVSLKSRKKSPLGRHKLKLDDNIKVDLNNHRQAVVSH